MSNASSAVVRIVITQIIAIIGGLILGAIAHFLFGDWGLAIFVVYILLGFASGGPTIKDISSASVLSRTSFSLQQQIILSTLIPI